MANLPLVSVVVPTFNSGSSLGRCLSSISRQGYLEIETLVVDNFSTDGTPEIAGEHGAVLIQEVGNVSEARNRGIRSSRGEYVLMLDADQELSDGLVDECICLFEEHEVDGIILHEVSMGEGVWAKGFEFEKRLVEGDERREIPRFFRGDVLRKLGGFDTQLKFGEDWDLYLRLIKSGGRVMSASRSILHYEDDVLSEVVRKYVRYGRSMGPLLTKHSQGVVSRYSPLPSDPENFLKLFTRIPLHGVWFLFLRMVRGVSLFFGMLSDVS